MFEHLGIGASSAFEQLLADQRRFRDQITSLTAGIDVFNSTRNLASQLGFDRLQLGGITSVAAEMSKALEIPGIHGIDLLQSRNAIGALGGVLETMSKVTAASGVLDRPNLGHFGADSYFRAGALDLFSVTRAQSALAGLDPFLTSHGVLPGKIGISKSISEILASMSPSPVEVLSAARFRCDEREFAADEIEELIREEIAVDDGESLRDLLHEILSAVLRIQDSTAQKVLWIFIVPVIGGIIQGLVMIGIQKSLDDAPPTQSVLTQKTVERIVELHDVPEFGTDSLRVVARSGVVVRFKPRRRSGVEAVLERGQVVDVLWRKRAWTMIEVSGNDDEEPVVGWVFSRYLLKLRR